MRGKIKITCCALLSSFSLVSFCLDLLSILCEDGGCCIMGAVKVWYWIVFVCQSFDGDMFILAYHLVIKEHCDKNTFETLI